MSEVKPYLDSLDASPETTAQVMEWAKYLGKTFGGSQSLNALRYYRDLDWISDEVHQEMRSYLRGLSIDELGTEIEVEDATDIDTVADSPFGVHAESLRYIAKIAGVNFSEEALQIEVAQERAEDEDFPFDNDSNDA